MEPDTGDSESGREGRRRCMYAQILCFYVCAYAMYGQVQQHCSKGCDIRPFTKLKTVSAIWKVRLGQTLHDVRAGGCGLHGPPYCN